MSDDLVKRHVEALQASNLRLSGAFLRLSGALYDMTAERDRLREALLDHNDLLRSALAIAKREGVEGQIASTNWDAYYNRVAVALKRHHQTANEALAALTQKDRTND